MDDAAFGRLLTRLLADAHRCGPDDLPSLLRGAARSMGLLDATIFVADIQQNLLAPLPDGPGPSASDEARPSLAVDGTLAGWAYRTESLRITSGDDLTIWLPLVDGIERIGVIRLMAPHLDASTLDQCKTLASLTGQLVHSKAEYSDTILHTARTRPMTMQAELAWAFMPPRTIGNDRVTSSAVLEPAYEIGGDAFDHSLTADTLHVSVVDAMGHDLASGLSAAVAMAGCRSTRRAGGSLTDITTAVDDALNRWLPERLLTAVFADLDLHTGVLTWVNRGHPPPLIIRRQRVVPGALKRASQLPLGLAPEVSSPASTIHQVQLQPGDRVLIHTDGVTEARSSTGEQFGEQRLIDTIVRATSAGEPASEALRRLIHTILDHHRDHLTDDATILLAEWHPHVSAPGPRSSLVDSGQNTELGRDGGTAA